MNDMQASSGETGLEIAPAEGKLGVMLVGLGAVSTTFIAGVEGVRRGLSRPIGSITQMSTIRLGKRTEHRSPLIRDFVPLAGLEDLVFGAWDPIPDDAYESYDRGWTPSVSPEPSTFPQMDEYPEEPL